jgi:hypothetical protein
MGARNMERSQSSTRRHHHGPHHISCRLLLKNSTRKIQTRKLPIHNIDQLSGRIPKHIRRLVIQQYRIMAGQRLPHMVPMENRKNTRQGNHKKVRSSNRTRTANNSLGWYFPFFSSFSAYRTTLISRALSSFLLQTTTNRVLSSRTMLERRIVEKRRGFMFLVLSLVFLQQDRLLLLARLRLFR